MIWPIVEIGTSLLISLAFLFVAAFMARGVFKVIRGEAILPDALTDEEVKAMRSLEASAREVVASDLDSGPTLGLSVALHELDAAREKEKIRKLASSN